MATPAQRIVTVVHATGKQGSGVVHALLRSGLYHVRAVTRDATTAKAKELASWGAELAEADASDAEQLRGAFEGAYGVYGMTFSAWAIADPQEGIEFEYNLGKAQADAAAAAGVKVFVFSTLEEIEHRVQGRWLVPHFWAKGRVVAYVKAAHPAMAAVFPALGIFYTNFVDTFPHTKDDDGTLVFNVPFDPAVKLPWANPLTAMGPVVLAALEEPEKLKNAFVPVYDQVAAPGDLIETFTERTGVKARYSQIPLEAWLARGMRRLTTHYPDFEQHGYYAPTRDMELVRRINPQPMTWADFLDVTGFDGTQALPELRARMLQ